MPIFDFKCPTCDKFEADVWIKVKQDTVDNYPVCAEHGPMEKQWGRANATFKGRGFHATDYRAPTRGY